MQATATNRAAKERPILFSSPMVLALLGERKTQTRRVVKWHPYHPGESVNFEFSGMDLGYYFTGVPSSGWVLRTRGGGGCWNDRTKPAHCPYGRVGDRLWVREAWRPILTGIKAGGIDYRADDPGASGEGFMPWKPSIHMPRAASRLTLEITGVRVERLQALCEEDAIAEGCGPGFVPVPHPEFSDMQTTRCVGHRPMFARLWDEINGEGSWKLNPWVWVVGFRCLKTEQFTSAESSI